MSLKALPFVILNAFLFGSTLVASRFSVGNFPPLVYLSFRLLIASSAFLLIYLLRPEAHFPLDGSLWRRVGVFGVFGTALNLVLNVSALQYLSSGVVSVILSLSPAMTVLWAHFLLPEERLRGWQWLGLLFAFSGAALLAFSGESGIPDIAQADPRGYLMVLGAVLANSIMAIYVRKMLKNDNSIQVASIRMFVAALTLIPLTVFTVQYDPVPVSPIAAGAVIYAGLVGTFGGFFVQLYNIQHFGAVPGSMVTYLIPIFAGTGGVLLLGEHFTPIMFLGVAIIITGIALVQRRV
ncbi:MAG: DMT family transporter [Anaerolineae bacterium]|nr:DMT family transporter [Anaerolineae bacterium]